MNAAEVQAVIAKAKAAFPDLTPNGFDANDVRPFDAEEIETAVAFLRLCEPIKKPSRSSYGLQHMAEDRGRGNGITSYVSNGALIVAAVALDCPVVRRGGRNAGIGISKRSLRKIMAGILRLIEFP